MFIIIDLLFIKNMYINLIFLIYIFKNPAWNQKFKFSVDEHHHYLNICVWVKLRDERGDLLIGHVRTIDGSCLLEN